MGEIPAGQRLRQMVIFPCFFFPMLKANNVDSPVVTKAVPCVGRRQASLHCLGTGTSGRKI